MSSSTTETQEMPAVTSRQTIEGHTDWVGGAVHLPGGQHIITCSWDGSLRLWDLESGAQVGDDWRDEGYDAGVRTIALSPNGKEVASGSWDGNVRLWDVARGKVIAKWTGHIGGIVSVCWSANGERVLSGSELYGTACLWDAKTGKTVVGPIETGHEYMHAVMCSPDASKFATGGFNESGVKIWDCKTGGKLLATLKDDGHAVHSLAWTSNGKKLISGSHGSISIFNTVTWEQVVIIKGHMNAYVEAITLSSNDRLLVSASDDKTAHLWNLDTNLPIGPPFQHNDYVDCATFSADGKLLVTGCRDQNAYVWDVYAILKEAGFEDLLPIPDASAENFLVGECEAEGNGLPPDFFFDDARHGARSSATYGPGDHHRSSARRRALLPSFGSLNAALSRLASLIRPSYSNVGEVIELQQRPRQSTFSHRRSPIVEVAAVRDKQALFVAPRHKPKPMQQQSQPQSQAQTSSSQTQPAAASASTTPPAPDTSNTTPDVVLEGMILALIRGEHTQAVHFKISKFYHVVSIQGTSLDAFAASAEEILNISELSILRAILEPTEIIRHEMPDGEIQYEIRQQQYQ
ncbi:WD40-repeat-containing domain protein [Suillus clintonianus]|uniref:WD40-repeat-containing domain protein n=1 Tax=Suillus clintonianus TaxID=1904413 RepID=UPI001B883B63|nr:WD40-repeat-containing domain protein [Suillus clintonianus]KAG2144604.1 WD40-repeat-containing domain protein [Suillus clintonianus]